VHTEALALARSEWAISRVDLLVSLFAAGGRAVVPHGSAVARVVVAVDVVAGPVALWRILLRAQQSRLAVAILHLALEDVGDHVISQQVVAVAVLIGCDVVALLDI
jgi:hypothetical protein